MDYGDDRTDNRISTVLKEEVSRLLETDTGSVITRSNALKALRQSIRAESGPRKQSLMEEYADGALSRRQFLRLLGFSVGGMVVGIGGAGFVMQRRDTTPTGYVSKRGITFSNVYDAVEDLGMQRAPNDGSRDDIEPIDSIMNQYAKDDTLIKFPPGSYRFRQQMMLPDVQNFGILGTGTNRKEVRFYERGNRALHDADNNDGNNMHFLNFSRGGSSGTARNILVENICLDQQNPYVGGGNLGMVFEVQDGLQVRNIEFVGFNPAKSFNGDKEGDGREITVRITNPDGEGVVDGYVSMGGSEMYPHGSYSGPGNASRIGVAHHSGTVYFRNCHIENGGTHGMYATHTDGTVRVEGSLAKNNNLTQLRIGGTNSWVKDSVIVVDTDSAPNLDPSASQQEIKQAIMDGGDYPPNYDGKDGLQGRIRGEGPRSAKPADDEVVFNNTPGLLWQSYNKSTQGLVQNTDIICRSYAREWGKNPYLLGVYGDYGAMTVKNCRVYNKATDVRRILRFNKPGGFGFGPKPPSTPHNIVIEQVDIIDEGTGGRQMIFLEGRDDSVIRDCCLQSDARNGIRLENSDNCTIENTNINVAGEPIRNSGSSGTTQRNVNTGYGGSCQMPKKDESDWEQATRSNVSGSTGSSNSRDARC